MTRFFIAAFMAWALVLIASGRIIATFEIPRPTEDDPTAVIGFNMALDLANAPLACANFMSLVGLKDEYWLTPVGVTNPNFPQYVPTILCPVGGGADPLDLRFCGPGEADPFLLNRGRPPLQVEVQRNRDNEIAAVKIIYLDLVLASLGSRGPDGVHREINGATNFEWREIELAGRRRFLITMKHDRSWIDFKTGEVVKDEPYYQDLPIHRIAPGRALFSGTRNGEISENAGYFFQDELVRTGGGIEDPYARPFAVPGILAMDNFGPNTNSSAFFITAEDDATLEWTGRYTPFGQALTVLDLNTINELVNVELNPDQSPLRPIGFSRITLSRLVADQSDFLDGFFFEPFERRKIPNQLNIHSVSIKPALGPVIEGERGVDAVIPPFSAGGHLITLSASSDLRNYRFANFGYSPPVVIRPGEQTIFPETRISLNSDMRSFDRRFYRANVATYDFDLETSENFWPSQKMELAGATYFCHSPEIGTFRITFDASGFGATYLITAPAGGGSPESGSFTPGYSFADGPYRGRLKLNQHSGPLPFDEMTIHFDGLGNLQSATLPDIDRFEWEMGDEDPPVIVRGHILRTR